MTIDYSVIKDDNIRRYGTDIGRIGPMLLANRYDDRTHFIFELLQNAEDALRRRLIQDGPRSVTFSLSRHALRVSHHGEPFTEPNVRAICGIGESTKSEALTSIGSFGIGFKSVYAFADSPEVHSGKENFAIDSFVWPRAIESVNGGQDETVFVFPFRPDDATAFDDITSGMKRLGARTLLFLREIEEISWSVEGGQSGLYLRGKPEEINTNCRKVLLIGQEEGCKDTEETWLIYSQEVFRNDKTSAGYIEVAFALDEDVNGQLSSIRQVPDSTLVVYFPTIVPTNLGFLIQGPYRTTPSRDNVPRSDPWNQHLVQETATLLIQALRSMQDQGMLNAKALCNLPLDRTKFPEGSMFEPLFETVRNALASEPLLPCFNGGHTSARNVKLARTQELRELFSSNQLTALFEHDGELNWLTSDITQNNTPELRHYLIRELDITAVTSEMVLSKLDKSFLESQSDQWILKLYEFLKRQPTLQRRTEDIPLIRIEDGMHVTVRSNGQLQAFLPSEIETGFPTVKRTVCETEDARQFLQTLGLTEPDPVDDVIRNVLPRYSGDAADYDAVDYEADIHRILTAFNTDSKGQREKLITALRKASFVMAVYAGDGSKRIAKPGNVYLATDRLKKLFAGVPDVLLVNDAYSCLRGEAVRELLEACGATRYLKPIRVDADLSGKQRREIRRKAGLERSTWESPITDVTLRGLRELLNLLPVLDIEARREKGSLLWESLAVLENRRGSGAFQAEYTWGYSHISKTCYLDAAFVRQLNAEAWVPDADGELQRPEFILFDMLGWESNLFLLSKIHFKPPIIETLAKEAGFDPGMLDLLKRLGVTSEDQLRARLGLEDQPENPTPSEPDGVSEISKPTLPATDSGREEGGRTGTGMGTGINHASMGQGSHAGTQSAGTGTGRKRSPDSTGGRPFISYVGVHPHKGDTDPDGLDHHIRMALEKKAIQNILGKEPRLRCTPPNNPGFDLFEPGSDGHPARWIEVKAMTGSLTDRPVGLSQRQFECAREHGEAYWLYVVEHASDDVNSRVVRIQDPAGKARTFTFDSGWLSIAEVNKY